MRRRIRRLCAVFVFSAIFTVASVFSAEPAAASSSQLVKRVSGSGMVVSFTFDDSESADNVYAVLRILAQNNIKATFFITGKGAAEHPDLVKAISDAGQEIGSHSYSHKAFTSFSYSQMQADLNRADEVISGITGKSAKPLFRPPFGAINSAVLHAVGDAGYTNTITWSIDTRDWRGASASSIYWSVMNNVAPGAIILMHCNAGASNTKYALQNIIDGLRERGYSFTTVSGLLAGISDGWIQSDGGWRYFRDGVLVKNNWAKDDKGWCYIDSEGFWADRTMWVMDSRGWCFIGDDGYWVQRSMWAKDSGGWCHIGDDGYWDGNPPAQAIPTEEQQIVIKLQSGLE
ncbi:MAG: polysaccharide deacetylase family protein [Clostridiaceae bacterium]